MAQENQFIDFRSLIIRILKNWYWFVLSCLICGVLGGLSYYSKTLKFTVDSKIMLRSNENENNFLPQNELMGMMGVNSGKNAADEVEILSSRDNITKIVKQLDLQSEYRKKDILRWKGQYPYRDLTIQYPPLFLDTMGRVVKVDLKVRKKDYIVRVPYRTRTM